MSATRTSVDSIRAEIPYLRRELEIVHVEYTARILGGETLETHTMPVRNGRTAAEPPSLEREGFELFTSPSRVVQRAPRRARRAEAATADAPDRVRLLGRDDPADPTADRRARGPAAACLHRSVQLGGESLRDDDAGGLGAPRLRDRRDCGAAAADVGARAGATSSPSAATCSTRHGASLSDPPQDYPLAVCDARTVSTCGYRAHRLPPELRRGRHHVPLAGEPLQRPPRVVVLPRPDHRRDDRVRRLRLGATLQPNTLHVAFEDTTARDPLPRSSVETRYFVLFD